MNIADWIDTIATDTPDVATLPQPTVVQRQNKTQAGYYVVSLVGRNRTTGDNRGRVYHATTAPEAWGVNAHPALCGARPGRTSNGFVYEADDSSVAVSCSRCLKKMEVQA